MSAKTNIKICGITNAEDGIAIGKLGVDFLGFVFYPPSPRSIDPQQAGTIIQALRATLPEPPACIGVFVDETAPRIREVRQIARLDGAQLAGDETPEVCAALEPFRIRGLSVNTLERLGAFQAEAYLCDTHAPKQKGGTGKAYDYDILKPHLKRHRIIIAGGLTPESVSDVVLRLRPFGVDVSSALESKPGRKDLAKTSAFVEAVRLADRKAPETS